MARVDIVAQSRRQIFTRGLIVSTTISSLVSFIYMDKDILIELLPHAMH